MEPDRRVPGAASGPRARPAIPSHPMTADLALEERLIDIDLQAAASGDHPGAARHLERLAARQHPGQRAQYLVTAGVQWGLAGDPDKELAAYRAATTDGGSAFPDARAYLAGALLKAGEEAAARELFEQLHRERPRDPDVYLLVGEALEAHGDLAGAIRWFTCGLLRAESYGSDFDVLYLARSRWRARAAAGLPEDDFHAAAAFAFIGAG